MRTHRRNRPLERRLGSKPQETVAKMWPLLWDMGLETENMADSGSEQAGREGGESRD